LRPSKRRKRRRGRHERRLSVSARRRSSVNYASVIVRGRESVKRRGKEIEKGRGRGTGRGTGRGRGKGSERETGTETEIGIGTGTGTGMIAEGDMMKTTPGTDTLRRTPANRHRRLNCQRRRVSGLNRRL
jgi:hypothetical protein